MRIQIPAKTFLVGEYVAPTGGPALILTTTPVFTVSTTDTPGFSGVHPDSPAGRFWQAKGLNSGLIWQDPYHGLGGLGASSAQFLGAYMAAMQANELLVDADELLASYLQYSASGLGVAPSGYDVLAQAAQQCVFIHKQRAMREVYSWAFKDLAFILLHTGQKLATHTHLAELQMPINVSALATIVLEACEAMCIRNATGLIDAVNAYHHALLALNLVAEHSMQLIELLSKQPDILALKGCGAMGADVLLLLTRPANVQGLCALLHAQGRRVLATSADLYLRIE
jgi:mevalonate kinase